MTNLRRSPGFATGTHPCHGHTERRVAARGRSQGAPSAKAWGAPSPISHCDELEPEEVIARAKARRHQVRAVRHRQRPVTLVVDGKPFEVTSFAMTWRPTGGGRRSKFRCVLEGGCGAAGPVDQRPLRRPGGRGDDLTIRPPGRRDADARFIGDADKRIAEDYLRILRFFRFFAHFGRRTARRRGLKACMRARGKLAKRLRRKGSGRN